MKNQLPIMKHFQNPYETEYAHLPETNTIVFFFPPINHVFSIFESQKDPSFLTDPFGCCSWDDRFHIKGGDGVGAGGGHYLADRRQNQRPIRDALHADPVPYVPLQSPQSSAW